MHTTITPQKKNNTNLKCDNMTFTLVNINMCMALDMYGLIIYPYPY